MHAKSPSRLKLKGKKEAWYYLVFKDLSCVRLLCQELHNYLNHLKAFLTLFD